MSRSLTSRLVLRYSQAPAPRCAAQGARLFSQTGSRHAPNDPQDDVPPNNSKRVVPPRPSASTSFLKDFYGGPSQAGGGSGGRGSTAQQPSTNTMASLAQNIVFKSLNSSSSLDTSSLSGGGSAQAVEKKEDALEPFHFHVYCHKHNTHITCTRPNRDPIISMSCGNIGFRKSRRGTFDSAYSLAKYVLERLTYTGWPMKISRLELVLQGFGQGREAVVKVLMSPEGKVLRDKLIRVADSTRIKFGGTRSKKPRRL